MHENIPCHRLLVAAGLALMVSCMASDAGNDRDLDVPERYGYLYDGISRQGGDEAIRARLPYDRIELERTGCFGTCPAYKVTLHRDGRAEYEGLAFVDLEGAHGGRINLADFGRLCFAIERLRFFEMNESYAARWTDDATTTLRVHGVTPGEFHEVSDYGQQGPPEFWVLTQAVDAVANEIGWTAKK